MTIPAPRATSTAEMESAYRRGRLPDRPHGPVASRGSDRYASSESLRSLRGIYAAARAQLSPADWDYLWCGVGDEVTVRENTAAFEGWRFRAPLFTGVARPDSSTRLLGLDLTLPLLTAPIGNEAVFDQEGHRAVGRAAERFGIRQMVPVAGSYSLEDVAAASSAAAIFQMTMVGDHQDVLDMIDRAAKAGYMYICATFSPIGQWRERLIEGAYLARRSAEDINFADGKSSEAPLRELLAFTHRRWDWGALAALVERSALPVMVKGFLGADDARRAVEAGACAVYVSNYGGRNLDRVRTTIEALPEVRAAVGPDVPIILDSGVRRGSDIAVALALGATCVAVGRLVGLGLAAGGEYGVLRVLELLQREFWMTMGQLGCSTVSELTRDRLEWAGLRPWGSGDVLVGDGWRIGR